MAMNYETVEAEKFTLEVDLGNDAMNSFMDVADVLRDVAWKVRAGVRDGNVRDANGNTVGQWEFK